MCCNTGYYSRSSTWGTTFIKVRVSQCIIGFSLGSSTSDTLLTCYVNSFKQCGFSLWDSFYTSLASCAADNGDNPKVFKKLTEVPVAYSIGGGSKGVSLTSCGSEDHNGTPVKVCNSYAVSVNTCLHKDGRAVGLAGHTPALYHFEGNKGIVHLNNRYEPLMSSVPLLTPVWKANSNELDSCNTIEPNPG
jgi:hypothetical protein